MVQWISHPLILRGETVTLLPLDESHFEELQHIAEDAGIWQFYTFNGGNPATMRSWLQGAISDRDKGIQYAFVIMHNASQKLIGSTRYLDMNSFFKKLEVGATWLSPAYWGT